jgi:hypothetical protein
MSNLVIDVFANSVHETTVKIPLLVLQIASKLMPRQAIAAIEAKGLNVQEIINAAKSGEVFGNILDITDHKDDARIVISVV